MSRIDVKIVDGSDWTGLYIGDTLVEQNHSLHLTSVLGRLENTNVGSVMSFEVGDEWLEENGLPEYFYDIPEEQLK